MPTYNSAKFLDKCLESIRKQTYENIEIIIVDKSSTDDTVEIAKKYSAKVFIIDARERCGQINYAARRANGKYLYRVDSDFILESTVIAEAIKKCENECFDALCIHNTSDPTISFWSRVRKFERDMYKDDDINVAARFFKKEVFEEIGGFNEDLVACEDYDLHNRILEKGYVIGRINSIEIHIGEPRSILDIAKKHYYYGTTLKKFIKANPWRGLKQLSPLRPSYFRHRSEFLNSPSLTIGFAIYQIVRYSSAGFGYFVEDMKKRFA